MISLLGLQFHLKISKGMQWHKLESTQSSKTVVEPNDLELIVEKPKWLKSIKIWFLKAFFANSL